MPPPTDPPSITQHLLSLAHPDPTLASTIYTEKIKSRTLNLTPSTSTPDARTLRRLSRQKNYPPRGTKPKPLTAKQKRSLRLYDIPAECRKWEIYVPLNRLWTGYIQDVLFGDGGMQSSSFGGMGEGKAERHLKGRAMLAGQDFAAKMMGADLHGAEIKVVRSRCPSRVGIKGIMVKETKMTFEIVTKEDLIKVIPKEHSIFEIQVPPKPPPYPAAAETVGEVRNLVFEIHGSNFMYRAADRGSKKFKAKSTADV